MSAANGAPSGGPEAAKTARTKVFLRLRPLPLGLEARGDAEQNTVEVTAQDAIRVVPPPSSQLVMRKASDVQELRFSRVFGPESSQEMLYEGVGQPLVRSFLEAQQNVLLFAYGITNSGKTYTMLGRKGAPGLLPRALGDIFAALDGGTIAVGENKAALRLSFLEVYNEQIFDLLDENNERPRGGLKLKDRNGHIDVDGLRKVLVSSQDEAVELLDNGATRRQCATNNINRTSSRSHSVCCIELLESRTEDGQSWVADRPRANFWIVDLAGSERSQKTAFGLGRQRRGQTEANNINTSLMKLWRCIELMRKNQESTSGRGHVVPFRESKLTHLFSNHLAGGTAGQTAIVVNISPSAKDYDETQHVLANAALAQRVRSVDNSRKYLRAFARLQGTHGLDGRKNGRRRRSSGVKRGWIRTPPRSGAQRTSVVPASAPVAAARFASASASDRDDDDDDDDESGAETDTALTGRQAVYRQQQQLSEENALLRLTVATLSDKLMQAEHEVRSEACDLLLVGADAPGPVMTAAVHRTWARALRRLCPEADRGAPDEGASCMSAEDSRMHEAGDEAAHWLRRALAPMRAAPAPLGDHHPPSAQAKAQQAGAAAVDKENRNSNGTPEEPAAARKEPVRLSPQQGHRDMLNLREALLAHEVHALKADLRGGEVAAKRQLEKRLQVETEQAEQIRDLETWRDRALKAEEQMMLLRGRKVRRTSEVAVVKM